MDKNDIEKYINRLKDLDSKINSIDDPNAEISDDFVNELNDVLLTLNKDIEANMRKKVQETPKLNVRFKKLHPEAVTPTYAKEGDAVLALTTIGITFENENDIIYGTGISIEIPKGYIGLLFSIGFTHNLSTKNSIGIITTNNIDEIVIKLDKTNKSHSVVYEIGDIIGYILILPFPQIELIEIT